MRRQRPSSGASPGCSGALWQWPAVHTAVPSHAYGRPRMHGGSRFIILIIILIIMTFDIIHVSIYTQPTIELVGVATDVTALRQPHSAAHGRVADRAPTLVALRALSLQRDARVSAQGPTAA